VKVGESGDEGDDELVCARSCVTQTRRDDQEVCEVHVEVESRDGVINAEC